MSNSPPIFLFLLLLAGLLGTGAMLLGPKRPPGAPLRLVRVLAALPALFTLAAFYSLAIHLHVSLGGWPTSIGSEGFPGLLATHADLASALFSGLLIASIVGCPIAAVITASVERYRPVLPWVGIFALACSVCFAVMTLAPSEFLSWWWD